MVLAVAGAGGALYFVGTGPGRPPPRLPAAPPPAPASSPPTAPPSPAVAPAPAAAGPAGLAEALPPELVEALPPEPSASPPGEAGAGAAATPGGASRGVRPLVLAPPEQPALRAAQLAVVLDGVDATLHGVRLSWPGRPGPIGWRWPAWATATALDDDLAALAAQLGDGDDELTRAARRWLAVARSAIPHLSDRVAAWPPPADGSEDRLAIELREAFHRLATASRELHAVVDAALPPAAPGSLAALARACRVAPLLAGLPLRGAAARGATVVELDGRLRPLPPQAPLPAGSLRAQAAACLQAASAHAAVREGPPLTATDVRALALAGAIGSGLLDEELRRADPATERGVFVSRAPLLAQQSSYLAALRRAHDPALRPPP